MTARRLTAVLVSVAATWAFAPSASADLTAFRSPSGNVGCVMDTDFARCDIRKRDFRLPRKPKSCDVDFGQGVAVDRKGPAGFVCAGDTALIGRRTLAYGKTKTRGAFLCRSTRAAMRCKNTRTGRGFSLSRQRYRFF